MKLTELLGRLSSLKYHDSHSVGIRVNNPHATIGGSPFEPFAKLSVGFDWDNGRIFLDTNRKLFVDLEKHNKAAMAMGEIFGWLRDKKMSDSDKVKIITRIVDHYIE